MLIFPSISVIRENLKGINDCVINKIIKQKELTEIIYKMLRNNN